MYRRLYSVAALALLAGLSGNARAFDPAAGDFAKTNPNHVRVLEYNVEDYFVTNSGVTSNQLRRVFQAINPDVVVMEEMQLNVTTAQIKTTLEGYFPGTTWTVFRGATDGFDRNVIATRHTLTMTITDTNPPSDTDIGLRGATSGLVTTPQGSFYLIGAHWKCCTSGASDHQKRQKAADGIINWMRDARTPGGNINLPANTPMMVVGDFNVGQDDNDDLAPYHPIRTILQGDIFDEASYGADSPPDWDGSFATDAVPYDHTSGNPRTWPSDDTPNSRLDRFVYTDSVISATNRFILSTRTMSADALAAAGLLATDTSSGPDHMPCVVDFAFTPETSTVGELLINEFSYDDPGADDRSFVEFINTGTRALNLEAPVAYRFLRTSGSAPTTIPGAQNETTAYSLRGVIPPGGLFVLYDAAGESAAIAATVQANLPPLQRQDSSSFFLYNGPANGITLVRNDRNSDGEDIYSNIDSYLYADDTPGSDNYLRTNSGNSLLIAYGAAQSTTIAVATNSESIARNVGDFTANSFANWTIPQSSTPGQPNGALPTPTATATPTPSPSPSPSASPSPTNSPTPSPSPSASPSPSPTFTPSPTATPSLSPTATPNAQQGFIVY